MPSGKAVVQSSFARKSCLWWAQCDAECSR